MKVCNDLTDGRTKLMGVDNARKTTPRAPPPVGKGEKGVVLRENHPAQLAGST